MRHSISRFLPLRNLTAIIILLLTAGKTQAQLVQYYSFSEQVGSYSAITGGTLLGSGSSLDNEMFPITLPFNFSFDGVVYTQGRACMNGYLSLGSTSPGANNFSPILNSTTGYAVIAAYARDLAGFGTISEVRTLLTGITPNRIFTIQWKDLTDNQLSGFVYNFQIKIHETTNAIDVIYGSCTSAGNTTAAQVGLRGTANTYYNSRSSNTGWTTTTTATSNSATVTISPSLLPPSGLTFSWSEPPACVAPVAQPTALVLTPTGTTTIGGSFTAAIGADKYLVVRTPNVPLNTAPVNGTTYSVGNTLGNGTVVYAGANTTFTSNGLTSNNFYTYTIFAYNDVGCLGGSAYLITSPLSGTQQTWGPKKYTWIPTSGSASFATSTNWSPTRFNAQTNDTLVFNNGGNVTVTAVPTQTIAILEILNASTVNLVSAATNTLTIGNYLTVAQSASLTLSGTLTITQANVSVVDNIYGIVNIDNSSVLNLIDGSTDVYGSVSVIGSGASVNNVSTFAPGNVVFHAGSTYNHARNGGSIPKCTYTSASTVNITGMVNTTPTFTLLQDFGNFNWNCTGQTAIGTLGATIDSIKGTFTVTATNTSLLRLGSGNTTVKAHSFVQNGGTFQVSSGADILSVYNNVTLNGGTFDLSGVNSLTSVVVAGNFTQNAGHTLTKTLTGSPKLVFQGQQPQNVIMNGTVTAAISYVLNNYFGATLTGSVPVNTGATNTINAGNWSGTGSFTYAATNSTLSYISNSALLGTSIEWPAANSPTNLMLNLTGVSPNNQLNLPGTRSLTGTLTQTKGILVLNNFDLTIPGSTGNYIITPDTFTFIAADSTGYLQRTISTTSATSYLYPVGGVKNNIVSYAPATLTMESNTANRTIGVKVKRQQHPNDLSSTDHLSRYWSFTDNGGTAAYTYTGSFGYRNNEVAGTNNFSLNTWNGSTWAQLPSYVQGYIFTTSSIDGALVISSPVSSSIYPLHNHDLTARPTVASTYTWTGATSTDYQVPTNWTPNRNMIAATDILLFNSGTSHLVTNVPAEHVRRLHFSNNTTATFQSAVNTTSTMYYKIHSDNNSAAELNIENGSALIVNGTLHPLRIGFDGVGSTASIAGTLELVNTAWDNCINFANCTGTVTTTGLLAIGTTNVTISVLTPLNLTINGTYEHKYTSASGYIPDCNWGTNSILKITGITNAGGVGGITSTVGKLIYNCPNQLAPYCNWFGKIPSVRDSLIIISTGAGEWRWTSNIDYNSEIGHFYMSGGTVSFAATANSTQFLTVKNSFTQTGGTLTSGGTTGTATIDFAGTTGTQNVSLFNNSIAGPITYRVSNPNGINLTGTGTLTSNFNINTAGGIQISSGAATPINTAFTLVYSATNTTLTYDAPTNITTTAAIYPATSGPQNLTANLGSNNKVSIPFNRTVPGTLKMTSGNIDMGANTLTLGTSQSSAGTLTYSSGYINTSGGGAFTRWFGTTGLPTTPNVNAGYFPLGYNGADRRVYLYFSSSTAFTNGGTISVGHNNVLGNTTGLSVSDGTFTITDRTNSSWNFATGNGLTMPTATASVRAIAGDLVTATTPANLRLMYANAVTGTHVTGSGTTPVYQLGRTGITQADLTAGPFYVGADGGNINGAWTSIATGNWNNAAIWDAGTTPPAGAVVNISQGTTVTSNATNVGQVLNILSGGTLNVTSGTLSIGDLVTNNGTVTISGGQVTMGPVGGGKYGFTNFGQLTVNSGTLNINGYLYHTASSTFTHNNGNINIDGNAAFNTANSVASPYSLLQFYSPNVTLAGGTLTFIDPAAYQSSTNAIRKQFTGNVTASPGYNTIFGDGISTTAGLGFEFDLEASGYLKLGNVVVNGSPSGNGRFTRQNDTTRIGGNFTINNANGQYSMYTKTMKIDGDITVNAGTLFDDDGWIHFTKPSGTPQQVSGAGTFQFTTGFPSPALYNIAVNNNAGGVVINLGDLSIQGIVFQSGLVNIGSANTALLNSFVNTASASTGWLIGKCKLPIPTSPQTIPFPVGDLNYYTPVTLTGDAITTGYIRVSVTGTDHPNINTSSFNPNKTVNRYYTIDTSGGITYPPNSVTLIASWNTPEIDNGANGANFVPAVYRNGAWVSAPLFNAGYLGMQVMNLGNDYWGSWQFGETGQTPVITTQPLNQASCSGNSASFSVVANFAATYQWQEYNGSTWSNLSNSSMYNGVTTSILNIYNLTLGMNSYQYRCIVSNSSGSTTSSAAALSVSSTLVPTITVSVLPGTTVCAGTQQTFTAAITNGGNTPSYQWKVNGMNVGTNGNTFITSSLVNNDVVTSQLTSSSPCAIPTVVTSTPMTITITTGTSPTASVTGNINPCTGVSTTYTVVTNITSPSYQWQVNGVNVGTNSSTYAYIPANNDLVKCIVTNTGTSCYTTNSITSNVLTITLATPVTPTASVTGNTTVCTGTATTYTVTTNITSATYQWQVNGVNVGTSSTTYNYTPANNDQVKCIVTATSGCYTSNSVASATLTITVNPSVTPTISVVGNTSVCSGLTQTYTATTNVTGGSFQWQVNGVNAGTNSATYAYIPTNNDQVKCIITVPVGGCYSGTTATSNTLTITISTNVAPTASITGNSTVCAGTSTTYTATTNITSPSYQWQVNGVNAGTNNIAYTYTPANGDQVMCIVSVVGTSCYTSNNVTSNTITITVDPVVTPTASISGNTSVCVGSSETYTATTNITAATYQWTVNGVNTGGNSSTLTYSPANGDQLTCIVTASSGCYTTNNITSNQLTINVSTLTTPTITISAPAAASIGTPVVVNAIVNNAGTNYSIDWKNNGSTFDVTTVPTTTYTKGPGQDNITATITPAGCYTVEVSNTATVDELLGVHNINGQNTIHVYPNPFNEEIKVTLLNKNDVLKLFDAAGKMVIVRTIINNTGVETINMKNIADGAYTLRITDASGKVRQTFPIQKLSGK